MKNICGTVVLFAVFLNLSAQEQPMNGFDANFAHVVYFWFHEPDNVEHQQRFERSLTQFLNRSKYAKTKFIGRPPKAVRSVVDDSFTYNLILSFDSAEAQQAYQSEPVHLVFVEECEDLWKKVIVYDAQGIAK